jgi:hypothetical protein
MKRPEDESTRLSDFGDEVVSGREHSTSDGTEATMLRVQHAVGVVPGRAIAIPASLKSSIWEELMSTNVSLPRSATVASPPVSGSAASRPVDRFRHNVVRWQSGISLAAVLAILVGLVAVVYQAGPLQEAGDQDANTFGRVQYDPDDPSIILPVSDTCKSNGEVPSDEEIAAMRISDWVEPQYYPAHFTDEAAAEAIQWTFLNYVICNLWFGYSATPDPNFPSRVSSEMTSYMSDRFRLGRMYESLPASKQEELVPFLCLPREEMIQQHFPLPVNRPYRHMAVETIDGNRIDVDFQAFHASDVYSLPDGRYGAIVGSIAAGILQNPEAYGHNSFAYFIAFVEVDGRYFVDEVVSVFTGIEPGSDELALPWTCP